MCFLFNLADKPQRKAAAKATKQISKTFKTNRRKAPLPSTPGKSTPGTSGYQSARRAAHLDDSQVDPEAADFETAESDFEEGGDVPPPPVIMVDFDIQDEADEGTAQVEARAIKLDFDRKDIKGWLHRLEVRLEWAGVKSQWLKRLCLENMLPQDIAHPCNDLFGLTKTEAAAEASTKNIYKVCKDRLLKVFGPKPKENYRKAMTIVLTGLPSEAAKEIRTLICEKKPPLVNCCCATSVSEKWENILPQEVKVAIAGMDFKNEFDKVVQKADDAYLSINATPAMTVASTKVEKKKAVKPAVTPATAELDTSADQPAFDQMNQLTAQLAAFNKNFKKRNKGGAQRGGKRAGSTKGQSSNVDDPPAGSCPIHKKHGRAAYYCLSPDSCPMANYTTPKK